MKVDKMIRFYKNVVDDYIYIVVCLYSLVLEEFIVIKKYLLKVVELFEKLRKVEGWVLLDEDLKLIEFFWYYMFNIEVVKDFLYRCIKVFIDYENLNKVLDKVWLKSKDVKLVEVY